MGAKEESGKRGVLRLGPVWDEAGGWEQEVDRLQCPEQKLSHGHLSALEQKLHKGCLLPPHCSPPLPPFPTAISPLRGLLGRRGV